MFGMTPLHLAVRDRQEKVVDYLCGLRSIDKELTNNEGLTPKQYADSSPAASDRGYNPDFCQL